MEQQVTGAPDGDVAYHFILDDDGARVDGGSVANADLVIVTDFPTAVAIHTGETNAQRALATKRLSLKGDIGLLVRRADALKALDDVFAAVRAKTRVTTA